MRSVKCIVCLMAASFLLVWLMPVPVLAEENNAEPGSFINLIVAVDCSKSMQSSDYGWKVPESLAFLINACPSDDDIRFSLILYGTDSEIVIRDMPLGDQNKDYLIDKIEEEIRKTEYNLGATDTGKALKDAQSILEEKSGQKSSVLLITDGRIEAKKEGRTTEISKTEVLEFASYAQDHDCQIDVIALPRNTDTAEVRKGIREDLNELVRKTGGSYHELDSLEFVPGLLLEFLEKTLDVKAFIPEKSDNLTGVLAEGIKGSSFFKINLEIDTQLVSSVTLIVNDIREGKGNAILKSPDDSMYAVSGKINGHQKLQEAPGATCIPGNGYEIIQMDRSGFDSWVGDWEIYLPRSADSAVLSAFYVYDVEVVLDIPADAPGVMEATRVSAYLVTDDNMIVDDLGFTEKLEASIKVVNTANNSVEDWHNNRGEGGNGDNSAFPLIGHEYVYQFIPERVSEYVIEVTVQTDCFEKTVTSGPIAVQDRLSVVSSLDQLQPKKNQEVTIWAYLETSDHQKVESTDYYEMSGIYAEIKNRDTDVMKKVEMKCREDQTGMYGIFIPEDPGNYEVVVYTESVRELVQRHGEKLTFYIEDHLPYVVESNSWVNPILIKEKEYELDLNTMFGDEDGDKLDYPVIECLEGDFSYREYLGIMNFACWETGKTVIRIVARDQYGNCVELEQEKLCMTMFELLMAGLVVFIFVILFAAFLVDIYCRSCRMNGLLELEIVYNDAAQIKEVSKEYKEGSVKPEDYPEKHMGSVIICLADKNGCEPMSEKRKLFHKRIYPLEGMIKKFRQRYIITYGAGDCDEILRKLESKCREIYLTGGMRDDFMVLHKSQEVSAKWDMGNGRKAGKLKKGKYGTLLLHAHGENDAIVWKIRLTYF